MSSMDSIVGAAGRKAIRGGDFATAQQCVNELLRVDARDPEGLFLQGLLARAGNDAGKAEASFRAALEVAPNRYDAAIELANLHLARQEFNEAVALVDAHEASLHGSPRYLTAAGNILTTVGLAERAHALFARAHELQPTAELFAANLAASSVYMGDIERARSLYSGLLERNPAHQRNHYYLSRLEKATDDRHVQQMLKVLERGNLPAERNIYLYYALGKELEDLQRWDESFSFYRRGAEAVRQKIDYDIDDDRRLMQSLRDVCTAQWLAAPAVAVDADRPTPIFVLGLPRTGTTVTDRILASHSQVSSIGETRAVEASLRAASPIQFGGRMTAAMIRSLSDADFAAIGKAYLDSVAYITGGSPFFVEKMPANSLYIGFIARAFPQARIVLLHRNPMDACFGIYKQLFANAYFYSYSLDDLGEYYVEYDALMRHWREVLGERIIDIDYQQLVSDQESVTRRLLDAVGLPFEQACLDFQNNRSATATASSVQVREPLHAKFIGKWRRYEAHLGELAARLDRAGIEY